jgi:DNA uptake protein ComE-like DNA-binding protein
MNNRLILLAIPALITLAACGDSDGDNDVALQTDGAQSSAPTTGDTAAPSMTIDTGAGAAGTSVQAAKLDVNTASDDQLRTIPGVGDKMVHEFEEYRPYTSIRQFRKEIGKYVDEATVAGYEKYLFVPIDHNKSDAETLAQIPGLDASEAGQLVAARPFTSRDAFFEKLGTMISPAELETARTYVSN